MLKADKGIFGKAALFKSEKVTLGIAPIGWCNDDMPELGGECTFEQIVSEMALAGFTGTEIGNKYPKDAKVLKAALDLRGMRVASRWFSSFLVEKPFAETEQAFVAELDFLESVGCNRINVSEQSHSIQGQMDTPVFSGKYVLQIEEWDRLCGGLTRLGKIAKDRGFKLCFHHHMGTVVQTEEEVDKLMEGTNPDLVFLCFDTGHFEFAGVSATKMLHKYVSRVGHVHLKDIRPEVIAKAKNENWSFLKSVREGAFTVPGDGSYAFPEAFEILSKASYTGWLLVEAEQDPAKANPLEYAIKARNYIQKHTGI